MRLGTTFQSFILNPIQSFKRCSLYSNYSSRKNGVFKHLHRSPRWHYLKPTRCFYRLWQRVCIPSGTPGLVCIHTAGRKNKRESQIFYSFFFYSECEDVGKGAFGLFWFPYIALLQRWLGCLNKVRPISNPVPASLGGFILLLVIQLFVVKHQEKEVIWKWCASHTTMIQMHVLFLSGPIKERRGKKVHLHRTRAFLRITYNPFTRVLPLLGGERTMKDWEDVMTWKKV